VKKIGDTLHSPKLDKLETGRDDVLGLPLSGVHPRHDVGGRTGDCGFSAEPGLYDVAVCDQAVLGRPISIDHRLNIGFSNR